MLVNNNVSVIGHPVLAPAIRQEKKNRRHPNWKEVKLSLFADDKIFNIENSKDTTKKLRELINGFDKVSGYKINIHKSTAFLQTDNKGSEREIKINLT